MPDEVNGVNYYILMTLFWGSDSTDVISTIDGVNNASILIPENITELDIFSSLAYPFFHGSMVYKDDRKNSVFGYMADKPITYGHLSFSALNGCPLPSSDNVPETMNGESLSEDVFITGIDTFDDGESEYVDVKIHFVSVDFLKFIANMKDITTFNGYDEGAKPVDQLLKDMFGAVGLGDRLADDTLTMEAKVPYISSENDTLLTALDYVYRKIFDYDFRERDGKTYCRFVYDFGIKKYVLWNFDEVGTQNSIKSDENNLILKSRREIVAVNAGVGSDAININGKAFIKTNGNQSVLFESLSNTKFVDYDYLSNKFVDIDFTDTDKSFMPHNDELDSRSMSSSKLVLGNSRLFKENTYEKSFSTSRQNAGIYDIFTEAIFNTSFMRAESEGSIGRRPGMSVAVVFNRPDGTIYERLSGTYLITAVDNHYEQSGSVKTFRSIMDLYRPYCRTDSSS